MRIVIQRVHEASVAVDGEVVGRIGRGLLVLVGIRRGDDESDLRYVADKLLDLRVFEDDTGRMDRSVRETGGEVLLISQFTLYGDCRRGRRPSFDAAARPEDAKALYESFLAYVRNHGVHVQSGVFGAHMEVRLANDGPVTLMLDSSKEF